VHPAVPKVTSDTVAVATARLKAAGFDPLATTTTRFDAVVPAGEVSGTSPASGASVTKGSHITIITSEGPEALPIPTLTGLQESQAKSAIRSAKFLVGSPTIRQFDPKIAKGTVLDFLGSDGTSLLAAPTYSEKRPITLIVSAGPLPAVANLSVDAATAALKNVGLTAETGSAVYSSTIPSGNVVQIDPQDNSAGVGRVFRVGDTSPVLLITSRGPQMVPVPDVTGQTWANAKATLIAAGFTTLNYDHNADLVGGNLATVTKVSPSAGTLVPKGTALSIKFNFND
jgi:beta-lactam-binding protein with PASTA domain